jgi:hypothetical protein
MLDWLGYIFLNQPAWRLYREIRSSSPPLVFYPGLAQCRMHVIGEATSGWKRCMVAITESNLAIYLNARYMKADFTCSSDELRWFGRPLKYHSDENEIIVHAEAGNEWKVLSLRISRYYMHQFVRAIKLIATPEQVKAYRRSRPYVHYGPVEAYPATQDIHGAWTLAEAVTLYVTPAFLVFLHETRVLRSVPLEQMQHIEALRRLDMPGAQGLVRFKLAEETVALAVDEHTALAHALAEAARRTLEEPIIQKQKKLDDSEEWD